MVIARRSSFSMRDDADTKCFSAVWTMHDAEIVSHIILSFPNPRFVVTKSRYLVRLLRSLVYYLIRLILSSISLVLL